MFKDLKKAFREGKNSAMHEQVLSISDRLKDSSETTRYRMYGMLATNYIEMTKEFGPIDNMMDKGKIKLANILSKSARDIIETDIGRGLALQILSIFLETSTLKGERAKSVYNLTQEYINDAFDVLNGNDRVINVKDKPNKNHSSDSIKSENTVFINSDMTGKKTRLIRGEDSFYVDAVIFAAMLLSGKSEGYPVPNNLFSDNTLKTIEKCEVVTSAEAEQLAAYILSVTVEKNISSDNSDLGAQLQSLVDFLLGGEFEVAPEKFI